MTRQDTSRYRLRYLAHDIALPEGEFTIGRGNDCQLSLNDPLVSRNHARIVVHEELISVEDLKSRNGTTVNGERIRGRRRLKFGDQIKIGSQEMDVVHAHSGDPGKSSTVVFVRCRMCGALRPEDGSPCQVCGDVPSGSWQPETVEVERMDLPVLQEEEAEEPTEDQETRTSSSFLLLGGVAEKALLLGKADEAERILDGLLSPLLKSMRAGRIPERGQLNDASGYAVRLAAATMNRRWLDWVFEAHAIAGQLPARGVVDAIYGQVHRLRYPGSDALSRLVRLGQERESELSAADRFVLRRLEGLASACHGYSC